MTCSIDGCLDQIKCRGLCSFHDQRRRNGVNLLAPRKLRYPAKGFICCIEDCSEPVWSAGLCHFHDGRKRTGRSLYAAKDYRSLFKVGWIHKGYRWITLDDGSEVMEHRNLMEEYIGRKLLYNEVVHHKDEDKLNNDIDNLEIQDRDKHTSNHRKHQQPCRICGRLDPRKDGKGFDGALGLCSKHYSAYRAGKL